MAVRVVAPDLQARVIEQLADHMDQLDKEASRYVQERLAEMVAGEKATRSSRLHPAMRKLILELVDDVVEDALRHGELHRNGRRLAPTVERAS